jgi:hypothetical protein
MNFQQQMYSRLQKMKMTNLEDKLKSDQKKVRDLIKVHKKRDLTPGSRRLTKTKSIDAQNDD